jgi:hypothetical protein
MSNYSYLYRVKVNNKYYSFHLWYLSKYFSTVFIQVRMREIFHFNYLISK